MYNIIPLILILISLSVIIFIVAGKFSALASLDVDNIRVEKEAKVKEQIISTRFKRNFIKWNSKIINLGRLISVKAGTFFKWSYDKLYELRDRYKSEVVIPIGDKDKIVAEQFLEIEELKKKGDTESVEKKLIGIIGLDSKNIKAFEALGNYYFEAKNYDEASQTFKHILKLIEDNENLNGAAEIYYNLAIVLRAKEADEEALGSIKEALGIEPHNPRYLDTMLEISIINKDKAAALEAYKELKVVNPDNQKLKEFKEQIMNI